MKILRQFVTIVAENGQYQVLYLILGAFEKSPWEFHGHFTDPKIKVVNHEK